MKQFLLTFLFIFLSFSVFSQCHCDAPAHLSAPLVNPSLSTLVHLSWDYPECLHIEDHIITKSGSLYHNRIGNGLSTSCDIIAAHRFTAGEMTEYGNIQLDAVSFFPSELGADYTIMVWEGGSAEDGHYSPGDLIVNQTVTNSLIYFTLNTITLEMPITIDSTKELWIGYRAVVSGGYPLGVTNGIAATGESDLLFSNGEWKTMESLNLNYSWIIQGHCSTIVTDLQSFKLYRNGDLQKTFPKSVLNYTDTIFQTGSYHYDITTNWHSDCESEPTSCTVVLPTDYCLFGIDRLPFQENFSSCYGEQIPNCWSRLNPADIFTWSGYGGIQFFGTQSYAIIVALPKISESLSLQNLQLNFKLLRQSELQSIQVGIMSNPNDSSTFELLGTFSPANPNSWEEFALYLNSYEGVGRHIAFRCIGSDALPSNTIFLDDVALEFVPPCQSPTNLSATEVSTNSALISWDPPANPITENYILEIINVINETVDTVIISDNHLVLNNLEERNIYVINLYSNCGDEISEAISTQFITGCSGNGEIPIGSGSISQYDLPLNTYFKYSLTQQIYYASELGDSSTILYGIGFDYTYSAPFHVKTDVEIYLSHTNKSTFTSTSDWVTGNSLVLLYSGPLYCEPGWNYFHFNTPFNYNGEDNLVLMIRDNSGNYIGDYHTFNASSGWATSSLVMYSDYNALNFYSSGWGTNVRLSTNRSNVRFLTSCMDESACPAPNIISLSVSENSAEIQRIMNEDQTAIWEYKAEYQNDWIPLDPNENHILLSHLQSNTIYLVRAKAECESQSSEWKTTSFRTACGEHTNLPYIEDFQQHHETTSRPHCWHFIANTLNQIQITSYNALQISHALRISSSSGNYAIAALPKLEDHIPLENIYLEMDLFKTSSLYSIDIGVMTDPENASTFTTVRTISPSTTSSLVSETIYFSDFTESGKYIAFRSDSRISLRYNEIYIDNIKIDILPECGFPVNLNLDYLGETSAYLHWEVAPFGEVAYFTVERYNEISDSWELLDTTRNHFYIITGLEGLKEYQVRVKTSCRDGAESSYRYITFTTPCQSGGEQTIWGNIPVSYLPITSDKEYNFSQQIFQNSLFNGGTDITGIKLNFLGDNPLQEKMNVDIYLGHTSDPEFRATNDWRDLSTMELVYSGNFYCEPNTPVIFHFEEPFAYNGSDHLVLSIYDYSGYADRELDFGAHLSFGSHSMYVSSDTLFSLPSLPNGNFTSRRRSDISFFAECTDRECSRVNIIPSQITPTSALLNWSSTSESGVWSVEYRNVNTLEQHHTGLQSDPYILLDSLKPQSSYWVTVYTYCSSGDTLSSTTFFETPCAKINTLPFVENFDNHNLTVFPPCWSFYKSNPFDLSSLSVENAFVGQPSLYAKTVKSMQSAIIFPMIEHPLNIEELELTFDHYFGNSNIDIEVGVMTDPEDITTFSSVHTLAAPFAEWNLSKVKFDQYIGDGKYIAIKITNDNASSDHGFYMDNIVIDRIPDCSSPMNMRVTVIDYHHAKVLWDGVDSAISYEIVIGDHGFNPDTVSGTQIATTTSALFDFFTLHPNKMYDVFVRTICSDSSVSDWSSRYSFTMPCSYITANDLPYIESFDHWNGEILSDFIPPCWRRNSINCYEPSPFITSAGYYSAPAALQLGRSRPDEGILILPEIEASLNIDTLKISFKLYSNTSSNTQLIVGVLQDPEDITTFDTVEIITIDYLFVWSDQEVFFHHYEGVGKSIAIKYQVNSQKTFIDDLQITYSDCRAPRSIDFRDITSQSAVILFEGNGISNWFEFEYGEEEFALGTGTRYLTDTNIAELHFLDYSTTYDIYFRSICSDSSFSSWIGPFSFTTLCEKISMLPFFEDFDSEEAIPFCWRQEFVRNQNLWTIETGNRYSSGDTAHSGNNNACFQTSYRGASTLLIMPTFNLTNYRWADLTFWYAAEKWAADQDTLRIYYQADTETPWILIKEYYNSTRWTYDSIRLPNISQNYRIAFSGSSGYGYGILLDDVKIKGRLNDDPDFCASPIALEVPEERITTTTAFVTWQPEMENVYTWELGYKRRTDFNYTTIIVLANPHYILTDLEPSTAYDLRVRTVCGDDFYSSYRYTTFETEWVNEKYYSINIISGSGGTITPAGPVVQVLEGNQISFEIKPDVEHCISMIAIDGEPIYVYDSLSFTQTFVEVRKNYTLEVQFLGTGITTIEKDDHVQIFPNPATNILYLRLNKQYEKIEIINLLGECLFEKNIDQMELQISVAHLPAAPYFIRLIGKEGTTIRKIVVKRDE